MIITFVGESVISDKNKVKDMVHKIMQIYAGKNDTVCYCGGCGDFDDVCAETLKSLKAVYTGLKSIFVSPFIDSSYLKNHTSGDLYDELLCPILESMAPKCAVARRNEYMVNNADMIIAYVNHPCSDAYETLLYAKGKKKRIINLGNLNAL